MSRRRYAMGSFGGACLATFAFCWMITGGSWNFLQTGLFTNFYDAQARALLAGHWNVPPNVLSIEGIVEHGRTYMYFGPVPAILRMPVLLVTHRLDGRLTQPSMLLAYVVALLFTARLGWRIRQLVAGDHPVSPTEACLVGLVMLVIGVGSDLFFLGSDPIIYHEAEIWGAALAIAAFDFLVAFITRPSVRAAALAGVFATLAILSRGSVGAGPVAALALTALVWVAACLPRRAPRGQRAWRERLASFLGLPEPDAEPLQAIALVACVMVPVLSYVVINEVKFDTLFSVPFNRQVETAISAHRRATLAANGGSLFGLKFVPTALLAYLRPDALQVTRLFPWLMFPSAASVIGHVRYDDLDWASSIPATMPLLALWSVIGLAGIFGRRRRAESGREPGPLSNGSGDTAEAPTRTSREGSGAPSKPGVLRTPVVGAAVGTVGVLTIAFIANRYLADFMPLVVLAGLTGFQLTLRWGRALGAQGPWSGRRRPATRPLVITAMTLLGAFGLWSNVALSLLYQRELRPDVPISMRAGFVSFQERLDATLFGNPPKNVLRTATLGPHEAAGTLDIIGNCAALYQSTGLVAGWQAVERSPAGGHFRLWVTFPASSSNLWLPVLVNGLAHQGDYLALRSPTRGTYQFGYLFEAAGQRFVTGPVFSAVADRSYVIDAVLDPFLGEITAMVDGNSDYDLAYFVRNDRPVYVGLNPLGGPVAGRFPGSVRELPVVTPICETLRARFR
ncbi:MAG TPA: hypothetical protein VEH29_02355 [Acidimicrobiales bacterium]|nr:hypothetical protein [Acidimicrobiales bacterium]